MVRPVSMHAVLPIGTRFAEVVTLGDPYPTKNNLHKRTVSWMVMVRCDCGVEKAVRVWQLKQFRVKSCGCHSRKMHSRIVFTKGFRSGIKEE